MEDQDHVKDKKPLPPVCRSSVNNPLINELRRANVAQEFESHIGRRVFILIAQFPFMIIGTIVDVQGDYAFIKVETTHINDFDNMTARIHIDDIEVFFIEDGRFEIPNIQQIPGI
ncbi:hypothetical protein QUF99_14115 [Bacillus sp. DX4.1]|uniref:hypothetical protein n=1 Tax=Bacillus sp. DX4.1 TaxID=3055867 RepID=UPI0025A00AB4|nr:hypothetical protein [Bacillus sp. DX4.1]MDM5188409.1 hypothetical protein [Bacillus sp. DX4.1]